MYQYNEWDQALLQERVEQFRDQTRRFLSGELSDDAYRPLRLLNGLYIQRHAPMLRVAIPYGLLSSTQLRGLARVARDHDRGFGHFTTRQNIQFNWVRLEQVPEVLAFLAKVGLHSIQTSGNCIRNVTCDPLAGLMPDEVDNPLTWCEVVRQWATPHPEFSHLPRKFKIAVTASPKDRAATRIHDLGLQLIRDPSDALGFRISVGGGLGRDPHLARTLRAFLPADDLLDYLTAILRVYNLNGRRDNPYKARIKVLVNSLGLQAFKEQVESEWARIRRDQPVSALEAHRRVSERFTTPTHEAGGPSQPPALPMGTDAGRQAAYDRWLRFNTQAHRQPGYRVVFIPLKGPGRAPGDLTHQEMHALADLAERHGFGVLRSTHDQNLLLPDVPMADLPALWQALESLGLAHAHIGTLTDMIACPGLDFCNLANAATLPLAQDIQQHFDNLDYLHDLGNVQLNISGCVNACAHHHVGHIGLLGVEKQGASWYQIQLGGSSGEHARLGKVLGPAVPADQVVDALDSLLKVYLDQRQPDEPFLDTVQRIGLEPFKEHLYGPDHSRRKRRSRPAAADA
ncbi:nitrite/sulfite reductase [Ectothiorhodospira sp. BSL-9]|uniref:nitrite/sulfite reductase n=1 Tax=Ectothiorhodospira sp. BSL-9 TaxID=1442136 RepID=UPI0007B42663|nr:nitrite/sulfite reductase [Ectothiorhodospira sp. BSL-9]ANB02832.1 sulfite reductase [Ectothiorhodospira sp. BSL-9]TVQ73689.1 MAG: nitrite/sulfite reductase [Chromatiaceae bacterium]